ncbi:endonuclease III [Phenylobacterium sp.]|uniref:endonuclease III domain-containing protein n=1 Tax=Phenylobacterium sp. TaxID=1871053 RepID=UPI00286C3B2D|nr:endonuclease III [Phenylobacterium sp.]
MDPVSQLIKAVISGRTYDEVAWAAFIRLRAAFPNWATLTLADPSQIEPVIDPVTQAGDKARRLPILIRVIILKRGALNLDFLRDEPLHEAMEWLTRLPGVGIKAAAATLNFSTLARAVMTVDTHVHRVSRRLGLSARGDDRELAYDALMEQAPADWDADRFFELHWLMKAHGQSICTHFDPACDLCVLRETCPRIGVGRDQEGEVVAFRSPDA